MASVFLSYSREDVARAEAVAAALERFGHSVWWDRQLEGGSRFSQEIEQALKRADAVVVLWSAASVQSAWVQDEAAEGRDSARLVPAVIDDSKPPLGFRQYQAIDLSGWKGKGSSAALDALHRAVTAKAGAPAQASPEPKAARRARSFQGAGVAAALALVVAVAGLLYWFAWPSESGDGRQFRLQLGEVEALSGDVPDEVPGAFRDELMSALATDAAIVVTSAQPAAQGGEEGFLLNGSVRKAGDLLRFTVHVVNRKSGATIWSETLERSATPADLAPRQVAVSVSQALRCGLGGPSHHDRDLPDETLALYFNFCEEYWADTMGRPGNAARAVDVARRVVAAAPDFSRGWSGLGQVAMWAARTSGLGDAESLRSEALRAAERAIELDEQNSQAYEVLAGLQPPFAFAEREKIHEKAVSVRPGDCGCEYVGYGAFLSRVGRNAEAAAALKRAHDMIPLSADVNSGWAESLFVAGRPEEARGVVAEVLELWPDSAHLREILVRSAFWTGAHDEALAVLDDSRTPVTEAERAALRSALQALRSGSASARADAVGALHQLPQNDSANVSLIVTALAALGADQAALSLAAKQIEAEGARGLGVLFDPALAAARRTPQFDQIAGRFGLIAYWRQGDRHPDFCKGKDRPALCAKL